MLIMLVMVRAQASRVAPDFGRELCHSCQPSAGLCRRRSTLWGGACWYMDAEVHRIVSIEN
jgi:hypothetical protein